MMNRCICLFTVIYCLSSYKQSFGFNLLQNFTWSHLYQLFGFFELLLSSFRVWSHRRLPFVDFFFQLDKSINTNALQQATALVCSLYLQISYCIQQLAKNSLNLRFPPFFKYFSSQGVNKSVETHLIVILSDASLQRPAQYRHKKIASSLQTHCLVLRPHSQHTVLKGSENSQENLSSINCSTMSDFQFYIYSIIKEQHSEFKVPQVRKLILQELISLYQVQTVLIIFARFFCGQQVQLLMSDQPSIVKPLFHYSYRKEGNILDQQYNYQGNILAVVNSNGDIILYSANNQEQNREEIFSCDRKKGNQRKYAVLKIAWSLPIFGLFATATINRDIELYQCKKNTLNLSATVRIGSIPLSLAFCPIQSEVALAVGTSRGTIILLSQTLAELGSVVAHEQGVTCLAWDHKILSFQKNKWIMNNFSHIHRYVEADQMPQLISGSCDQTIKIWKREGNKLTELYRIKAHQKAVRDVQWRNTYLQSEKFMISCSQDGTVKIWRVKGTNEKIAALQLKESRDLGGPVYKANFNFLGNLIAISFCNEAEQKVETIIMKQKNGAMMGQQVKIHI